MDPLFKSPGHQHEFDKNGYLNLPGMLTAAEADELLGLYQTTLAEHNKIGIPFITTSHSNDHELIRKVDAMITAFLGPKMEAVMCNYKLLFSNFLVKTNDPNSITPAHQDITFVDEHIYPSVSAWVALSDCDHTNGCMRFLPGSHKFMFTLRPTHQFPWAYENVRKQIEERMIAYPCKKGDGFIFHHGVIHASYPNQTDEQRVAALLAAYPDKAELLHYFLPKGHKREVMKYRMDKEAYLHFVKEQPPARGVFLGIEEFDFRQVTPAEFESFFNG